MHPQAPYGPNYKSKSEDRKRRRNWGAFLDSQHFRGRRACWSSGMGLGRMTSNQSLTRTCIKHQTTSWLVHSWSTFGAKTNHVQIRTHKIHHGLDLGEATTFPLIVYFVFGHETSTQMTFVPGLLGGNLEIFKVRILAILGDHNFVWRPPIEMRSKAKL
jgi:hypothetical protein